MKTLSASIFILILSLIYCLPFFKTGYFKTHDGEWAIVRIAEMKRELRDLQIPPRWSDFLNHGYGYPLFNFVYPLPSFIGAILSLTPLGYLLSLKVMFVFSAVLSALLMFFLIRRLSGNIAGVIASMVYLVFPYRLLNLYVRGSIGESLSLVLFPLIFYLTISLVHKKTSLNIVFLSISNGLLFLTHNVMALLFFPLWLLFIFIYSRDYHISIAETVKNILLPVIFISFLLSSFFIIPSLVERKFILLSLIPLADKNLGFFPLLSIIFPDYKSDMSIYYSIGLFNTALILISFVAYFRSNPLQKRKNKYLFIFLIISTIIFISLTNRASIFIWQLPLLSNIDFPWRVLNIIGFITPLFAVLYGGKRKYLFIGLVLALSVSVFHCRLINNMERTERDDLYYMTNDDTTTSMKELMPLWVKEVPEERYFEKVEIISGSGNISGLEYNSRIINFNLDANEDAIVKINTIYYPGWQVKVNGYKKSINYQNDKGLITFNAEKGKNNIQAKFESTTLRKLSELFSIIGILICIAVIIKSFREPLFHRR